MVLTMIEQLCDSIREWSSVTGENPEDIVGIIMLYTGGERHVRGDHALSEEDLAKKDLGKITGRDRHGEYHVHHLERWLTYLANDVGLLEIFLVPAIVRSVEDYLEDRLLGREVSLGRREAIEKYLMEALEDPDARRRYFETLRQSGFAFEILSSDREQVEHLEKHLRFVRKMGAAPEGRLRDQAQVWRDVSRYIGSKENIDRFVNEMIRFQEGGGLD